MSIIFSSNLDVDGQSSLTGQAVSDTLSWMEFGEPNRRSNMTSDIARIRDGITDVVHKLQGENQENFDRSYIGSGKKLVVEGSHIEGGKVSPLEEANIKQVYTQTPNVSVVFKKRAFSSLAHLYDASMMDKAELWLMRATKRLIERKCFIMAEYERLVKIERMADVGSGIAAIMSSLVSAWIDDEMDFSALDIGGLVNPNKRTSTRELEKLILARRPVKTSTYFIDPEEPEIGVMGRGSGAFEFTTIVDVSTSLDLDGNGDCRLKIEDPYHILFVTEEDIETVIRETAEASFSNPLKSRKLISLLTSAQDGDERLSESRRSRGVSDITFNVDLGSSSGATAIIDAIGFPLTTSNLDDVPSNQALTQAEQSAFRSVMTGLKGYAEAVRLNYLQGQDSTKLQDDRESADYVRQKMRLYYLGKSIIQPMDTINVFMSGNTRRAGEGEDVDVAGDVATLDGAIKTAASVLSHYRSDGELGVGVDTALIQQEFEQFKQYGKSFLSFEDFKKLRTIQMTTDEMTHVFGGLILSSSETYNASNGTYVLSVSAGSNMEWLKVSRYNAQPSLDQTQGLVYDPFTPFQFDVDPVTGLPIGSPQLLPENKRIIQSATANGASCRDLENPPPPPLYYTSGPLRGKRVSLKDFEDQLSSDLKMVGQNISRLFQDAPGLKYRWKNGIMSAIYDIGTTNSQTGNYATYEELRRDVGLPVSNTPFDNMDAANIISIMVTGQPYNFSTFLRAAVGNTTYSLNTTSNVQKTYLASLLDLQKSFIKVHGNFEPYKTLTISPADAARAMYLQNQLTGASAELTQLRGSFAGISDKIANINGTDNPTFQSLIDQLNSKKTSIKESIEEAQEKFSMLLASGSQLENNVIHIAGNDVSFELKDKFAKFSKIFGDRLLHATMKRKEDVVYNRDKNFLIISDEYDKDYDIQAFVLLLKQQLADMWKSTWQPVFELCQNVAKILNFEFYCNSQGNLVFRPPQYNRTPASVLTAMLSYNHMSGIKVFPDFLLKLFATREESLLRDINVIEWEIKQDAALLGYTTFTDVQQFISSQTGSLFLFLYDQDELNLKKVIQGNQVLDPEEKFSLLSVIRRSNRAESVQTIKGLFTSSAQIDVYKQLVGPNSINLPSNNKSKKDAFEKASKQLSILTGQPLNNMPTYEQREVGVKKNGISTPASDISSIISSISQKVSRRASLLKVLDKMLEQSIEMQEINENAQFKLGTKPYQNIMSLFSFGDDKETSGIYDRLIEDDSRDAIGHMSGSRFVIREEHIISSTFNEKPPMMTSAVVTGTEPLIGESDGNVAGIPIHKAFTVDFDMWRQYGWRAESEFHKPFFWSADKQSAPYGVMLLSRQRKNIVTGTVQIIGNEFYQVGDVVYVSPRQMLYYVNKVSHNFSYEGRFTTTLDLVYGHPVGEYIPTPFDMIGKLSFSKTMSQNSFRVRREKPSLNQSLAVIRFSKNDFASNARSAFSSMLGGNFGATNFKKLINSVVVANGYLNPNDVLNSPKIFIISYAGDETIQEYRRQAVERWLSQPESPISAANGEGIGGLGSDFMPSMSSSGVGQDDLSGYVVDTNLIKSGHIHLCLPDGEQFTDVERDLLEKYYAAPSREARLIDSSLKNVIEIKLIQPPAGGWPW